MQYGKHMRKQDVPTWLKGRVHNQEKHNVVKHTLCSGVVDSVRDKCQDKKAQ